MCRDILENGVSTEGEKVRPKWEDGTSAYTIKKFGVVNRYDLAKEFPALTAAADSHQELYQRDALDLAEKVQQHPMTSRVPYGTSGRTRTVPSAKPTATRWVSSTVTRRE